MTADLTIFPGPKPPVPAHSYICKCGCNAYFIDAGGRCECVKCFAVSDVFSARREGGE